MQESTVCCHLSLCASAVKREVLVGRPRRGMEGALVDTHAIMSGIRSKSGTQ